MTAEATTTIEWLTELLRLSQAGSGGRQQAVDAMLAHVVRGFGGASGCLAIRPVDPADEGMRIAATIELPPDLIGRRILPGQGVLGSVLQCGEPLLINGDLREDARFAHLPAAPPTRRAGLAVTLAERRDSGMIHRIQRYTTQRIAPTTIVGLEPKRVEPKPAAPMGQRPAGKSFGPRPSGRPAFKPAGKTFSKPGARPR